MNLLILPCFKILKQFPCILTICLLIASCSTNQLPEIIPLASESKAFIKRKCENIFFHKKVQLVHALDFQFPGRNGSAVIGIINIDPQKQSLETVMMNIEGLVLFHSKVSPSGNQVLRSIDPFTFEHVRDALLKDIRLIFLIPDGTLVRSGMTPRGNEVCRYLNGDEVVDIELLKGGNWIVNQYSKRNKHSKSVVAQGIDNTSKDKLKSYPRKLILKNKDTVGYLVIMKLIKAEYVD